MPCFCGVSIEATIWPWLRESIKSRGGFDADQQRCSGVVSILIVVTNRSVSWLVIHLGSESLLFLTCSSNQLAFAHCRAWGRSCVSHCEYPMKQLWPKLVSSLECPAHPTLYYDKVVLWRQRPNTSYGRDTLPVKCHWTKPQKILSKPVVVCLAGSSILKSVFGWCLWVVEPN